MDTTVKATKVPMLVRSMSTPRGTNPASAPTKRPTIMVFRTGTRVVGLIRWKTSGSIPSRPMANRMRVCPYSTTRVTLKIEMVAPAASTAAGQPDPVMLRMITARAASWPANCPYGCAPIPASATST
jgi:hypothetical protein